MQRLQHGPTAYKDNTPEYSLNFSRCQPQVVLEDGTIPVELSVETHEWMKNENIQTHTPMEEDCGNLPILLCGVHTNLCRWASTFRPLSFPLNQISMGDTNIHQDSTHSWLSTFSPKALMFLPWTWDITIHGLWEFPQMSKRYWWPCIRYPKPLASCGQQLPFSLLQPSSRTYLWRNSIPSRNGTKGTRTFFTQSVDGHPPRATGQHRQLGTRWLASKLTWKVEGDTEAPNTYLLCGNQAGEGKWVTLSNCQLIYIIIEWHSFYVGWTSLQMSHIPAA